ncbi:hypothetical protein [Oceanobacillus locisalsi]|uniref:Uncharacterized protein n=1 Tax=Oceanobacillus locisalsi TaxID=546107 RepID=A0ABW3NI72_9BACI
MSNSFNSNQPMGYYNQQQSANNAPQQYMGNMGNNAQEQQVLTAIQPVVHHGMREAQHLGFPHALREATAIAYLMGQGQDFYTAWRTVESWWRPQTPSQPGTF